MKITWKDVKDTLLDLGNFVKEKGYMYTIASKEGLITEEWIEQARKMLYEFYEE